MSKYNYSQNSLSSGQLSDKMKGRYDLDQYRSGLDVAKNALGYKQGGSYRRPGSAHVLDFSSVLVRRSGIRVDLFKPQCAIPYGDDFVLVGNGNSIALIKLSDGTIEDSALRDYTTEDLESYFLDVREQVASGNFALRQISLDNCKDYTQVGDLLFITLEDYFPLVLRPEFFTSPATGNTMLTFVLQYAIDPLIDTKTFLQPFDGLPANTNDLPKHVIQQPYNATNVQKNRKVELLSDSSIRFTGFFPFGQEDALGTQVKIHVIKGDNSGLETVVVRLRSVSSFTANTITYSCNLVGSSRTTTPETDNFQLGAWNPVEGYPCAVTSYQQRLLYSQGDRLFGSQLGDLSHFMLDRLFQDVNQTDDISGAAYFGVPAETDPFDYRLSSSDPSPIRWLLGGDGVEAGTASLEYFGNFSRTEVSVNSQGSIGSSQVRPSKMGKYTVYIDSSGFNIYGYRRGDSSLNIYQSDQLDLFSENLYDSEKFVRMAYQNTTSTGWFLTDQGNVVSLTMHEDVGVRHASTHCFENEENVVCDLFVAGDFSYFIIEKDGRVHLERVGQEFRKSALFPTNEGGALAVSVPYFLDNSIYQKITPSTTVSNLDHLEGLDVGVLGDGVPYTATVTGGQITLPNAVEEVVVGVPYKSTWCILPIEAGGVLGTSVGSPQKNNEVWVCVYRSAGGQIAVNEDGDLSESLADDTNPEKLGEDSPRSLETKNIRVTGFGSCADNEQRFCITTSDPLPFNILSIVSRGQTYDT